MRCVGDPQKQSESLKRAPYKKVSDEESCSFQRIRNLRIHTYHELRASCGFQGSTQPPSLVRRKTGCSPRLLIRQRSRLARAPKPSSGIRAQLQGGDEVTSVAHEAALPFQEGVEPWHRAGLRAAARARARQEQLCVWHRGHTCATVPRVAALCGRVKHVLWVGESSQLRWWFVLLTKR